MLVVFSASNAPEPEFHNSQRRIQAKKIGEKR
jgi:hypothetical protein